MPCTSTCLNKVNRHPGVLARGNWTLQKNRKRSSKTRNWRIYVFYQMIIIMMHIMMMMKISCVCVCIYIYTYIYMMHTYYIHEDLVGSHSHEFSANCEAEAWWNAVPPMASHGFAERYFSRLARWCAVPFFPIALVYENDSISKINIVSSQANLLRCQIQSKKNVKMTRPATFIFFAATVFSFLFHCATGRSCYT